MSERQKLKKLAEEATDGEWFVREYNGGHIGVDVKNSKHHWKTDIFHPRVQGDGYGGGGSSREDAEYIAAANPSTILALLSELEQAERERDAAIQAANPNEDPCAEQLSHGRNCSALRGPKPPIWDSECTCGLGWRIQIQTEREMHNAWRKRAEESEAREKQLLVALGESNHFQLVQFREAEKKLMDWENLEASVCPEDYGFVEYIGVLQKQKVASEAALRTLRQASQRAQAQVLIAYDVFTPDIASAPDWPTTQQRMKVAHQLLEIGQGLAAALEEKD